MRTRALGITLAVTFLSMAINDASAGIIFRRRNCCPQPVCRVPMPTSSSGPIRPPMTTSELQAQILQLQNVITLQQQTISNHELRVRQLEARPVPK